MLISPFLLLLFSSSMIICVYFFLFLDYSSLLRTEFYTLHNGSFCADNFYTPSLSLFFTSPCFYRIFHNFNRCRQRAFSIRRASEGSGERKSLFNIYTEISCQYLYHLHFLFSSNGMFLPLLFYMNYSILSLLSHHCLTFF